jgi:EspG family
VTAPMTGTADTAPVHFGLVELDLLASYAGAELPFPLQVPAFGRVQPERDVLFATAGETLRMRGLADADGPLALADRLVALLARRSGGVDLVLGGPDWESGAVALVAGAGAVLCLQRFNAAEQHLVETYEVATDALAGELYSLVPELPGGHTIPLRLPLRALRAAHDLIQSADRELGEARLYEELLAGGVDATAAGKLASLLHPLEGYGQMGTTRQGGDGHDVRVGSELSWVDTSSGRYRISADDGWVSVNPLHPDELFSRLRDFVSRVRR